MLSLRAIDGKRAVAGRGRKQNLEPKEWAQRLLVQPLWLHLESLALNAYDVHYQYWGTPQRWHDFWPLDCQCLPCSPKGVIIAGLSYLLASCASVCIWVLDSGRLVDALPITQSVLQRYICLVPNCNLWYRFTDRWSQCKKPSSPAPLFPLLPRDSWWDFMCIWSKTRDSHKYCYLWTLRSWCIVDGEDKAGKKIAIFDAMSTWCARERSSLKRTTCKLLSCQLI